MKQERTEHEERYYITKDFTSAEDHQHPSGKEMDSAREHRPAPYETYLPMPYENGSPSGQIILQYVEEEVSYMADYEVNDANEIVNIRYDPVVSARKKCLILKKERRAPDTP